MKKGLTDKELAEVLINYFKDDLYRTTQDHLTWSFIEPEPPLKWWEKVLIKLKLRKRHSRPLNYNAIKMLDK